jgi:hypothetical protein
MSSRTISKVAMAQKEARPMICHWKSAKNESSGTIGCFWNDVHQFLSVRFNYHKSYKISKCW